MTRPAARVGARVRRQELHRRRVVLGARARRHGACRGRSPTRACSTPRAGRLGRLVRRRRDQHRARRASTATRDGELAEQDRADRRDRGRQRAPLHVRRSSRPRSVGSPARCARSACSRAIASPATCRWWPRSCSRCSPRRRSARSSSRSSPATRAPAVRERLEDAGVKLLFTADGALRRGQRASAQDPGRSRRRTASRCVEHVVVVRRVGSRVECPMRPGRDRFYDELVADAARRRRRRVPMPAMSAGADALHQRHHRQAQGHRAHPRRLPGADGQGAALQLRPAAERRLLLVLGHRLDDGPVGDHRLPACTAARS